MANISMGHVRRLQLVFARIVPPISLVITWECLVVVERLRTLHGHSVLRRTIALETAQ